MEQNSGIYIAGHRGLGGSAIHRNLLARGYTNFLLRTHAELDLENQAAVRGFFETERPEYVLLAAAVKVVKRFRLQARRTVGSRTYHAVSSDIHTRYLLVSFTLDARAHQRERR